MRSARLAATMLVPLALAGAASTAAAQETPERPVPPRVLDIINGPKYAGATWGIRMVDLRSGRLVYSLGPDSLFFTGSVRKLFSVAEALDALGPGYRFTHAGPPSRRAWTATARCTGTSCWRPAAT